MKKSCLFLLFVLSTSAWSSGIQVGQPLPALAITERGELLFENEAFSYALWGSSGFVVSEVKDSKKKYPLSTTVLDAHATWPGRNLE